MTAEALPWDRELEPTRLLAGALLVVGVGLVSAGWYVHVTMGDRTLGDCIESGACNPWHPQWVVAPLVLGGIAVVLGGYLALRR